MEQQKDSSLAPNPVAFDAGGRHQVNLRISSPQLSKIYKVEAAGCHRGDFSTTTGLTSFDMNALKKYAISGVARYNVKHSYPKFLLCGRPVA